jgi:ornithine cyclodeaminase
VRIVNAGEIDRVLSYGALIDALADAFRADIEVPLRHTHMIAQPSGGEAKLLLMPAWTNAASGAAQRLVGCKVVSVYPDNAKLNKPSVYGSYLLMSGDTGEPLALLDGTALTAWRTAAASALAARYLAREDAEHLVMVGAGALSAHLIRAHSAATARALARSPPPLRCTPPASSRSSRTTSRPRSAPRTSCRAPPCRPSRWFGANG